MNSGETILWTKWTIMDRVVELMSSIDFIKGLKRTSFFTLSTGDLGVKNIQSHSKS